MSSAFRKLSVAFFSVVIAFIADAQSNPHFLKASFSENVLADVLVSKVGKKGFQRIASYSLTPVDTEFAFALAEDTGEDYRLQINFMNPPEKRPKLIRICTLPLSLKAGKNYTLKINPAKLDTAKKTGWELKVDEAATSLAYIQGKLVNSTSNEPVSLQHVAEGELITNSYFNLSKSGEFVIPSDVKKAGFYYLATPRWRSRIYFSPSEKLQVTIDDKLGQVTALQGSRANQLLHQWQQLILPITSYGYNRTEPEIEGLDLSSYFKTFQQLQPSIDSFERSFLTSADPSMTAIQKAVQLDRELVPLTLLYALNTEEEKSPGSAVKEFKNVPAFYKQFIRENSFNDASVLILGEVKSYLDLFARLTLSLLPAERREAMSKGEKLRLMMNCFRNDTLKAFFLKDQLEQNVVNNYTEFRESFEPFQPYTKFAGVKNAYDRARKQFSADTVFIGKSSYNFTLPDTSGRMVSMKELKGKVVFVDVWASWCGPCKKEVPFLKEIEEEYSGKKDLVFVGISIDKVADKQQWLQAIRKQKLDGIQLLDDGGENFAHRYGITSIPRFMLIDKEGRWIEIRCPRPGAKNELKSYLDAALGDKIAGDTKMNTSISTK